MQHEIIEIIDKKRTVSATGHGMARHGTACHGTARHTDVSTLTLRVLSKKFILFFNIGDQATNFLWS
jgi:hypothetical protein